jgi:hypothetical protein
MIPAALDLEGRSPHGAGVRFVLARELGDRLNGAGYDAVVDERDAHDHQLVRAEEGLALFHVAVRCPLEDARQAEDDHPAGQHEPHLCERDVDDASAGRLDDIFT